MRIPCEHIFHRPSLKAALAAGAVLLIAAGRGMAQPLPNTGPTLLSVVEAVDAHGRAGLMFSFDRAAPLYSILGDATTQPAIAFAGAGKARGLTPPADVAKVAEAVTINQGSGVLTAHLRETSATRLQASASGDRAVFVAVLQGRPVASAAPSPVRSPAPMNESGGDFQVVRLKYADVSEIVGLLTTEQNIRPNDNFTPQEPAFGSAVMTGGATAPPPVVVQGATVPGGEPAVEMLGQTINETVGIDRRLNAIVLKGSPERVAELKAMIAKLDRPITSVVLETVFVELTESGAKNIGIDLSNANSQLATLTYGANTSVQATGGLRSFGTATLQASIYDQVQKGQGRIISKPNISAQSGGTAKIITGDALPILTSITLSGVNGVSQQVQYVTVGVTLQIAPRVTDDGFVTSHVFCEVSSVTGYSQGYPTISQREASTTATVKDGESFVIGGLTQENMLSTTGKTPGLSNLPGLGKLFDLQKATKSKTQLYIVITPRIVTATTDRIAQSPN